MFAVGGPVMAYHAYRQPMALANVRATLAVVFVVGNVARTIAVGSTGGLTVSIWVLFAAGLPVVFVFTALGRRFPPAVTDRTMRRLACLLVVLVGGFVGGAAVFHLWG